MTRNRKGRVGWHHATPKISKHTRDITGVVADVKGFIVTLALWGWLPMGLADWIIHRREPHDD